MLPRLDICAMLSRLPTLFFNLLLFQITAMLTEKMGGAVGGAERGKEREKDLFEIELITTQLDYTLLDEHLLAHTTTHTHTHPHAHKET